MQTVYELIIEILWKFIQNLMDKLGYNFTCVVALWHMQNCDLI